MATEQYSNNYESTLNGAILVGATSLVVTSATGAPTSGNFRLFIRAEGANTDEIVTVTAVAGTTFTITRATEAVAGTQAASAHGSGATVAHVLTAGGLGNNVQGQVGINSSIIIPGMAANPDIRVGGADDDEFDTTDTSDPMTGWTTVGSPTTHNINSTALSHYYVKKSAVTGVNWVGIYKAVPGLPDTVTAKISALNGTNASNTAAIFFGESPPGKIETLGIRFNANQQCRIEHDSFASPTGAGAAITVGGDIYPYCGPMYVRFVLTSSTNISAYSSTNGMLWLPLTVARNPGFTVGVVGLVVDSENATADVEGLFDWIRFT